MRSLRSMDELDELLAAADPCADEPAAALDDQAREDLAAILATDRRGAGIAPVEPSWSRRARFGRVVAVAATVALIGTVGVVAMVNRAPGSLAFAATPPLLQVEPLGLTDAPTLLRGIADRIIGLPDDSGNGRYAYTRNQAWSLHTTVDGERVTSEVVPTEHQSWIASDGSGRSVGRILWPDGAEDVSAHEHAVGELAVLGGRLANAVDDPDLTRRLTERHPVENGPAQRLVAVADLHRAQPVPPAARASLLRYVADTPGLVLTGRATDRAGRRGIAVHLDSAYGGLPTRYTLIFDEATGALLAKEDMLTETAGALNVRIPSVISYTVFLEARHVDSMR